MKATVKYYTRQYARQDGLSALFGTVCMAGRRVRTNTLLYVSRDKFDTARQCFRPSARVLQGNAPVEVKQANLMLLQAALEVARFAAPLRDAPADRDLIELFDEAFGVGRRQACNALPDLAAAMADEYAKAGKATNMYRSLASNLRVYTDYVGGVQTVHNFDPARYLDFLANAREIEDNTGVFTKNGRQRPVSLSKGGLRSADNFLRTFASWLVKRGHAKANIMEGTEPPKLAEREPVTLLPAELDRLQAAELSGKLADVRDLFLLQCGLGCRHSDLCRITPAHLANGMFEYIPSKTAERSQRVAAVPLNRRVRAILDRNPGLLDFAARLSLSEYNRQIRRMAEAAGLDRMVVTYVHDREEVLPLWRLLSSHAARRTFISTLLNAGVQESVIKAMDGHAKDSKAFKKYYTVERETRERAVKALE